MSDPGTSFYALGKVPTFLPTQAPSLPPTMSGAKWWLVKEMASCDTGQDVYLGEFRNGKRNGVGILKSHTGRAEMHTYDNDKEVEGEATDLLTEEMVELTDRLQEVQTAHGQAVGRCQELELQVKTLRKETSALTAERDKLAAKVSPAGRATPRTTHRHSRTWHGAPGSTDRKSVV